MLVRKGGPPDLGVRSDIGSERFCSIWCPDIWSMDAGFDEYMLPIMQVEVHGGDPEEGKNGTGERCADDVEVLLPMVDPPV